MLRFTMEEARKELRRAGRPRSEQARCDILDAAYKAFFHHIDGTMKIMVQLLRGGRFADEIMLAGQEIAPSHDF